MLREKSYHRYGQLVPGVLVVIMAVFSGCATASSGSSGIPAEANSPELAIEYVNPENLLAYITEEDSAIYVASGSEQAIQDKLGATVKGDVWYLPEEDFGVPRPKKKLEVIDLTPRMFIVKWVMYAGHECKEIDAGTWAPLKNDKTGELMFYFQVPEKKKICWAADRNVKVHVCKSWYQEITANISSRPNGQGARRRATFRVLICFD